MAQDTDTEPTKHLVRAADRTPADEVALRHPMNPNSEVYHHPLSNRVGMQRAHLNLARVPPGKESFIYHAHAVQEEYVYILSGNGTAEIGDERFAVGPGDYMGFPIDGVGHHLINTGDEYLVYLMGGERGGVEVASFPRLNRQLIFKDDTVTVVDLDRTTSLSTRDWVAKD